MGLRLRESFHLSSNNLRPILVLKFVHCSVVLQVHLKLFRYLCYKISITYHELLIHLFTAHKDPYENIYVVVRGHKDVILHAPTDHPWMGYKSFNQAVYKRNLQGALEPSELRDSEQIPWIATDPLAPDLEENPGYIVST